MKESTYNYIWINGIKPIIESIAEQIKKDVNDKDLDKFKEEIKLSYEQKRDRLKELYHYNMTRQGGLIDCHKVAACFAAVLYEHKFFSYEVKRGLTDEEFLANARLAYHTSLSIIYINLIYYYQKRGKEHLAHKLLEQGMLQTPPTNPGHDEYNLGREKTLALNDVFGNEFDILTYSDMMFWIEYYNRQVLEGTVTPDTNTTSDALGDQS